MLGSRLSLLGHSIDWPLSVWLEAQGKCNKHRNETVVEQILFFPLFLRPLSSPPIRKTAAEMPQENQPLCEMERWMKAADGNCTCSLGFLSGPRSPGTVIKPLASIVASYRGDKKRGMKKKVQGRTGEKIWFRFLCGCLEGRRRWRIISIHHRHNPDVIRQYGQTDFRADIADIGLLLFMAAIDRRAD